ncbi:MAG: hypothetical protein K9G43_01055 [Rhodobacteraceae bacterium]|nr:hypothetical protein [Paracoccaceae bacterium]
MFDGAAGLTFARAAIALLVVRMGLACAIPVLRRNTLSLTASQTCRPKAMADSTH